MQRRTSPTRLALLYLLAVLLPVALVMLWRPLPSARPFLVELSLALAFVGLVQIALQFLLIARFERVSASYGLDAVLRFHRYVALVAVLFVVAHPVILVIFEPAMLALLHPLHGSWGIRTANWALYAIILLALLSVFRKQLRLGYEAWRLSHTLLGIAAIVLAHLHVHLSGRYTDVWWKEALLITISAVAVALLAYLRLIRPALQRRSPYRVAELRPERGRVWSLALEPVGHAGMRFKPGQFGYLKLRHPYSVDEHPFSFASSAERPGRMAFAIKELGDFSDRIGTVPVGTKAFVDGPHGAFSSDLSPAAGYVLIAGGIGIAPFMSMLRTMADRSDRRPVLLVYGEKRWEDLAFREEIEGLRGKVVLDVVYTLDQPPGDWTGERGFITAELLRRHLPQEGIERMVFVCGPNPMIEAVEAALAQCGVPARLVHAERFDLV